MSPGKMYTNAKTSNTQRGKRWVASVVTTAGLALWCMSLR